MNTTQPQSAETVTTTPRDFERCECSRCGGTGNYSYCQMWGTRCFKCNGKKTVYTARGAAARKFFDDSLPTKAMQEIIPGDAIKFDWKLNSNKFNRVDSVACDLLNPGYITITAANGYSYGAPAEHRERIMTTPEQKAELFAAALAYQDSLTASGKPRKRRVK